MTTDTMLTGDQSNNAASSQAAEGTGATPPAADAAQQQQAAAQTEGDKPAGEAADGAKPEGDKPEGEKAEGDKKPEGAPEEYEDFAVAEGVALDAEAITEFKGLAKELGLSQADAQKVVDLGPKMLEKWQAKHAEAITTTVAKWAEDARADKEIGGDKLNENLAVAKKALDAFGTPELKTLLNESGLGNHPELIRLLHKAGKAISEDGYVGGKRDGAGNGGAKSFYSNSNMN